MLHILFKTALTISGTLVLALLAGIARSVGESLAKRLGWNTSIARALAPLPGRMLASIPNFGRLQKVWWFWLILGGSTGISAALGYVDSKIRDLEVQINDREFTDDMRSYFKSMLVRTHGDIRIVNSPSPDALGLATQIAGLMSETGWSVKFDPGKLSGDTPITQFRGSELDSATLAGAKLEGATLRLLTALLCVGIRVKPISDTTLENGAIRLAIGERYPGEKLEIGKDRRCNLTVNESTLDGR